MTAIASNRMSAETFFDWANLPENADRRWELVNGVPLEMPSPGALHGILAGWIAQILWQFALQRGSGRVITNDTGLIVSRGPDSVRGPDIMFVNDNRKLDEFPAGHLTDVPALIVEILSPSDRTGDTARRIEQYLHAGVPMVWVVDPPDRSVTVYQPGKILHVLDGDHELTGGEVLPDFKCKAADLFNLPGQAK